MEQQEKHIPITELVSTVYCEQKYVFDKAYGDVSPKRVVEAAKAGTAEHSQFESEGRAGNRGDSRCFVATHIYGSNATQTNLLRVWRDSRLMPSIAGRALVGVYYTISPTYLSLLRKSALLSRLTAILLDRFVLFIQR